MAQLAELTLGQIVGGGISIFVFLSIFIEITPIKVNPVSSFLTWFGKKTNGGLIEEVNQLKDEVSKIKDDAAERNAINCRVRILSFGDEIRRGLEHSKEHFDQILIDIDTYEQFCEEHPNFKNKRTVVTTAKIIDTYNYCIEHNKFL